MPAPFPEINLSPNGKSFATPLGKYTYSWVELGRQGLLNLHLANGVEDDPKRDSLWKQVSETRDKGETVMTPQRFLLYSRQCRNTKLTKAEREKKKIDYFVLLRDPEPGKKITEKYLTKAEAVKDEQGRPVIDFRLNKKGGELLHELTVQNRPDLGSGLRRNLAIILEGRIVGTPSIGAPIRDWGWIRGPFTEGELEALLKALRSGIAKEEK